MNKTIIFLLLILILVSGCDYAGDYNYSCGDIDNLIKKINNSFEVKYEMGYRDGFNDCFEEIEGVK